MKLKKFCELQFILLLPLFASACGQLDTVFTPSGSYRVSASVDGAALEDNSIVNSYSQIEPYFLDPIMEDPDIVGLKVSIHHMNGELAGGKIHYSWASGAETPGASGTEDPGTEGPGTASPGTAGFGTEDPGTAGLEIEDPETAGLETEDPGTWLDSWEPVLKPDPEATHTGGFIDESAAAFPWDGDEQNQEWPDPLGFDEPGDSGGVGPEASQTLTESSTLQGNRLEDPSLGISQSVSISNGGTANFYQEETIPIAPLDRYLPPFKFPDYLPPGQYLIVFQVQGIQGVVNSLEKPVMYIGDAEFELRKIQTYYSEDLGDSHIVSPGAVVMLESQIAWDPALDPYIVWYGGSRRISEGSIREISNRLLWEAPADSGFQTLRAEAFPFKPESSAQRRLKGRIIDLSIPVSQKNAKTSSPRAMDPSWGEATADYPFAGALTDSLDAGGNSLTPLGNSPISWKPRGKLYGLHIDETKRFALPENPFALSRNVSEGKGALRFRFAPLQEDAQSGETFIGRGALLTIQWNLETLSEKLFLEVSCADNELILRYGLGNEIKRTSRTLPPIPESLLGTSVYVVFDRQQFAASLVLEDESPVWDPSGLVYLPEPLTGRGAFTLGGALETRSGVSPGNPGLILDQALIQFAAGVPDWETLLENPEQTD